ncbi:NlpC/P60 family protein [Sinomonas sp. ASV486]|uniref:C40 family peptidase n=1 Tax=Sinomonas puerhi TaxID=3238584 RepID=A0AB39L869_9MICC|nr:NlpC/P60 family protein [Sinomonas sp. ASV486]MDQ4490892.1 NlpC/P60 family protein [Sinomonas sp. ASV486]
MSDNAGTIGRQAAVIAAASGLIISAGLPAQAAEAHRDASALSDVASASAPSVVASNEAQISFERPAVESVAAPVVQTTAAAASQTALTAQSSAPRAAATVNAAGSTLAAIAYTGIGHPYVWGGTTPAGWDCSGFTQWVYAQAGISIPRVQAWSIMTPTSTPQPGDLVVQNGGAHVGIYVGNGMMISALNPSQGTLLHAVAATGTSVFYTLGH